MLLTKRKLKPLRCGAGEDTCILWMGKTKNTYIGNIIGEKQTPLSEISKCKLTYLGHSLYKNENNLETVNGRDGGGPPSMVVEDKHR